jgi:hypothetical protein
MESLKAPVSSIPPAYCNLELLSSIAYNAITNQRDQGLPIMTQARSAALNVTLAVLQMQRDTKDIVILPREEYDEMVSAHVELNRHLGNALAQLRTYQDRQDSATPSDLPSDEIAKIHAGGLHIKGQWNGVLPDQEQLMKHINVAHHAATAILQQRCDVRESERDHFRNAFEDCSKALNTAEYELIEAEATIERVVGECALMIEEAQKYEDLYGRHKEVRLASSAARIRDVLKGGD